MIHYVTCAKCLMGGEPPVVEDPYTKGESSVTSIRCIHCGEFLNRHYEEEPKKETVNRKSKLKIRQEGKRLTALELNDVPVELDYLTSIRLDMTAGHYTTLTLEYHIKEVDIEAVDTPLLTKTIKEDHK